MTAIPQAYDITLTQEDQEVLFGFLEAILLAKLTEPSEFHHQEESLSRLFSYNSFYNQSVLSNLNHFSYIRKMPSSESIIIAHFLPIIAPTEVSHKVK